MAGGIEEADAHSEKQRGEQTTRGPSVDRDPRQLPLPGLPHSSILIPYDFGFFAGDGKLHDFVVVLIIQPQGPFPAFELESKTRQLAYRALDLHLLATDRLQADPHGQAILRHDSSEGGRA